MFVSPQSWKRVVTIGKSPKSCQDKLRKRTKKPALAGIVATRSRLFLTRLRALAVQARRGPSRPDSPPLRKWFGRNPLVPFQVKRICGRRHTAGKTLSFLNCKRFPRDESFPDRQHLTSRPVQASCRNKTPLPYPGCPATSRGLSLHASKPRESSGQHLRAATPVAPKIASRPDRNFPRRNAPDLP